MASKSDLIEAQNFSRRRLLTAFVSGAPGGKELEPSAPLRAVIAAIALTVGVVLVGVFYGLIKPGLPDGWDNGKLILVSDTGARYVTVDGQLHPVINTASARLLLPADGFGVITTDQQTLAGVALGSTLGIVGAPDQLPDPGALVNVGWTACVVDPSGLDVRIGTPTATATDRAVVVEADGERYVVFGERSYAVDSDAGDAVLRAAGITSLAPVSVPASWLNLFVPGTPLAPLEVSGAGATLSGTDLRVGDVVHIRGDADDERYLVQPDGTLAALSPLAWQLYLLGTGSDDGAAIEVSAAELSGVPTAAEPAGGADWPGDGFTPVGSGDRACALLTADGTVLATQAVGVEVQTQVAVDAGAGALVLAGGRGDQSSGILTLIDATGTAYPLPGATEETLARLGYGLDDVGAAAQGWTALLATGPALTEAAAGTSPAASG